MINTTRPAANAVASARCQKERMEFHDVRTYATPSKRRTMKVSHQSSLCRFSNLSNCAEIVELESAPGEGLPVGPWVGCCSSIIRAGAAPYGSIINRRPRHYGGV